MMRQQGDPRGHFKMRLSGEERDALQAIGEDIGDAAKFGPRGPQAGKVNLSEVIRILIRRAYDSSSVIQHAVRLPNGVVLTMPGEGLDRLEAYASSRNLPLISRKNIHGPWSDGK